MALPAPPPPPLPQTLLARRRDPARARSCICGDGGVGKTAVLQRQMEDSFIEDYQPTIFDDYECVLCSARDVARALIRWSICHPGKGDVTVDGHTGKILLRDTAGAPLPRGSAFGLA